MVPASADYELLETGMGPNETGQRQSWTWRLRWTWKRVVLFLVIVVGVVWIGSKSNPTTYTPTPHSSFPSPAPHSSSSPLTYETDPDPTLTTACTSAYHPTSPLVQYALIIDAGSTGSRIHVYKFNNCRASPTLEYEVFAQTQPGLSSYAHAPLLGAQSIDVLMDTAVRVVPRAMRRCTPVTVKATAGLRLLGDTDADAIVEAVRTRLGRWEFPVEAVGVMDGRDEGVYAWITANYLLGALEGAEAGNTTWAVLDLGGASTQIAFEPRTKDSELGAVLEDGEHKFELTMAERTHVLYQHSYLGYGLMRARQHVHQLVDFMAAIRANGDSPGERIGNPCIARTMERVVELNGRNVTMLGDDIASFDGCLKIIDLVMAKDAICKTKPCSFNGVYQPSILQSFPTGPILLLSYFYDRLAPLLPLLASSNNHNHNTLTIHTISTLASIVCSGPATWPSRLAPLPNETLDDLASRPEYCLDLTFMYALLRRGYEFEDAREVRVAKRVGGTELGWALGAALQVVGAELRCLD